MALLSRALALLVYEADKHDPSSSYRPRAMFVNGLLFCYSRPVDRSSCPATPCPHVFAEPVGAFAMLDATMKARSKFHALDVNHSALLSDSCLPERLVHLLRTSGVNSLRVVQAASAAAAGASCYLLLPVVSLLPSARLALSICRLHVRPRR
jgi:hypothetical protein